MSLTLPTLKRKATFFTREEMRSMFEFSLKEVKGDVEDVVFSQLNLLFVC